MATASFVTDITEIITQAVEAAAMVGSLWSSAQMVSQARAYYNLYNAQRQFYYSTFQQGAEAPLAASVYAEAIVLRDYAGAIGELYVGTGVFGGLMGDTLGWWQRHGLMFSAAPAAAILNNEYPSDYMLTKSQWGNVMFRFEEANVDLLNDQRWDHRMKLHNVALKQQSLAVSELASGSGLREEVMTNTTSYLGEVASSLAERRGLLQAHKDVQARYAAIANGSASVYVPQPRGAAGYRAPASPSAYHAETFALGTNPSSNAHFGTAP